MLVADQSRAALACNLLLELHVAMNDLVSMQMLEGRAERREYRGGLHLAKRTHFDQAVEDSSSGDEL